MVNTSLKQAVITPFLLACGLMLLPGAAQAHNRLSVDSHYQQIHGYQGYHHPAPRHGYIHQRPVYPSQGIRGHRSFGWTEPPKHHYHTPRRQHYDRQPARQSGPQYHYRHQGSSTQFRPRSR